MTKLRLTYFHHTSERQSQAVTVSDSTCQWLVIMITTHTPLPPP